MRSDPSEVRQLVSSAVRNVRLAARRRPRHRLPLPSRSLPATGWPSLDSNLPLEYDPSLVSLFGSSVIDPCPRGRQFTIQAFVRDRVAQTTHLVCVNSLGDVANAHVAQATISGDGRYVAFVTSASNFLPGTSTIKQVYLRDAVAGTTECITMTPHGEPGDAESTGVALGHDGRHVAFITEASNSAIDDQGGEDIYMKDRATGSFAWVSRTTAGEPMGLDHYRCLVSADGRFVAMQSHSLSRGCFVLLWDRDGLFDVP